MPYMYFSKLRGVFIQGIQRSNVVVEATLQDSLAVLIGHGKVLFGKPRFYSGQSIKDSDHCDLNVLLQYYSPCAAQLNLQPASRRKNLSVMGAVSRTFSTPSVSGPSLQVCGYHFDNLLSGSSRFSSGSSNLKTPMALFSSRTLLGGSCLSNMTSTRENRTGSSDDFCLSYTARRFHSCRKISMNSGNEERSDSFANHGYFIYHVATTNMNFNKGFQWKGFHISVAAFLTAGIASYVFSDNYGHDDQLANSANTSDRKTLSDRPLKLFSGSCCLPHPDKEETGGEDAHFICSDEQVVGVADGVGGWADFGIDAGKYSRELMSNSVSAIRDEPKGSVDPARVLDKAYTKTKAKGSSTACIIALTKQGLNAVNLGDSGFMVVRDGCTVFRSPVQQHDFNFPYQLENGSNSDLPSSGEVFSIPVAPGDVIIVGTDGLFDNLYNNDITAIVVHAVRAGLEPQVTAQKIAALARQRAHEKDRQTPFSAAAQEAGFRYYGGKLDDITVVVSYITASKDEDSSSLSST